MNGNGLVGRTIAAHCCAIFLIVHCHRKRAHRTPSVVCGSHSLAPFDRARCVREHVPRYWRDMPSDWSRSPPRMTMWICTRKCAFSHSIFSHSFLLQNHFVDWLWVSFLRPLNPNRSFNMQSLSHFFPFHPRHPPSPRSLSFRFMCLWRSWGEISVSSVH